MNLEINRTKELDVNASLVYVLQESEVENLLFLTDAEKKYVVASASQKVVVVNRYSHYLILAFYDGGGEAFSVAENLRLLGNKIENKVEELKIEKVQIGGTAASAQFAFVLEGLFLSSYSFIKYFKEAEKKSKSLKTLIIKDSCIEEDEFDELVHVTDAVFFARDAVNEPVSYLTAPVFADEMKAKGEAAGLRVDVYGKEWIESERMNGLLAVNKGSIDPPRFTVLEWKPENATNSKPIILVGKGIVFDTGGISLKTSAYMETMKSDMGGAAGVAGAMLAIAKNKLPVHIMAFIPSTDNRPDGNAYVPGDVVEMRNGVFVEVLNTDAEGRMILADGLSYASDFDPELVVDMATLTGAASMALAEHAVVLVGKADEHMFDLMVASGNESCERTVRLPFWDEYGELIKSDIADIKNVGGPQAGSITAGKFLEHFTSYPWMHLDISGSAFVKKDYNYRGKGATGFGVRLLYTFVKSYCQR